MPWAAAATVVVGVGSAISSNSSSKRAAASSEQAAMLNYALGMKELKYAQEQQAKWDSVFGPTQEILADYYNTLDSDTVAAQNVQALQTGHQKYQEKLDIQLAQRGMDNSGLQAELSAQGMYASERDKAQARVDAPGQVAEEQSNFLALGLGQQAGLQAGVQNAYGGLQSTANTQYNASTNQQNLADADFGAAIGGIGQVIGNTDWSSFKNPFTSYDQQEGFIGPQRS